MCALTIRGLIESNSRQHPDQLNHPNHDLPTGSVHSNQFPDSDQLNHPNHDLPTGSVHSNQFPDSVPENSGLSIPVETSNGERRDEEIDPTSSFDMESVIPSKIHCRTMRRGSIFSIGSLTMNDGTSIKEHILW